MIIPAGTCYDEWWALCQGHVFPAPHHPRSWQLEHPANKIIIHVVSLRRLSIGLFWNQKWNFNIPYLSSFKWSVKLANLKWALGHKRKDVAKRIFAVGIPSTWVSTMVLHLPLCIAIVRRQSRHETSITSYQFVVLDYYRDTIERVVTWNTF